MTNTDKLLKEIKADGEGGTQGDVVSMDGSFGDITVTCYSDDISRIARIPKMEARILSDTKKIEGLTSALEEIAGGASPDHYVPQYQQCVFVASAALLEYYHEEVTNDQT